MYFVVVFSIQNCFVIKFFPFQIKTAIQKIGYFINVGFSGDLLLSFFPKCVFSERLVSAFIIVIVPYYCNLMREKNDL